MALFTLLNVARKAFSKDGNCLTPSEMNPRFWDHRLGDCDGDFDLDDVVKIGSDCLEEVGKGIKFASEAVSNCAEAIGEGLGAAVEFLSVVI